MMLRIGSQLSPLCYLPSGKLVCYQRGDILVLDEDNIEKEFSLFKTVKERIIGRSRYFFRLLRLGIRAAEAIDENHIIISIGNELYELDLKSGKLSAGYFCGEGIRPLIFTAVNGIDGFNDGIYFGGYLGNISKNPVNVYKRISTDKWEVVYTFPQGAINHIHTIVPDSYRKCLWIFTGDFGVAAAIWKVTDHFNKVECIVSEDQKYRGCVAFALPEGLLYATDAPFADDYIYLLEPYTLKVKEIMPIDGSCIYGCQWKDKYVFSSTVEGDGRKTSLLQFYFGRKRGAGIKDNYVHLYCGNIRNGFKEIYKEKKDWMPFYTFQFGVFKFPYGLNTGNSLCFQPIATYKNDLVLMKIK